VGVGEGGGKGKEVDSSFQLHFILFRETTFSATALFLHSSGSWYGEEVKRKWVACGGFESSAPKSGDTLAFAKAAALKDPAGGHWNRGWTLESGEVGLGEGWRSKQGRGGEVLVR